MPVSKEEDGGRKEKGPLFPLAPDTLIVQWTFMLDWMLLPTLLRAAEAGTRGRHFNGISASFALEALSSVPLEYSPLSCLDLGKSHFQSGHLWLS